MPEELEPLPEPEPQQAAAPSTQAAPSGPPPRTLPADFFTSKKPEELAATGAYRNPGALARYPQAIQEKAKMLADYDAPVTPYMLARNPVWTTAAQAAKEFDPSFSMGQYDVRQKTRQAFSGGGSQALNKTSIGTAINHAGSLWDVIDKLDNYDSALVNPVKNWWERKNPLGMNGKDSGTAQKDWDVTSEALSSEMTRVFRGTGGAAADVEHWRKNLSLDDPKEQQKTAIRSAVKLLAGRIAALRQNYTESMGKPPYGVEFLSPDAKKTLQRMGFDPSKIELGVGDEDPRLEGKSASTPNQPKMITVQIPGQPPGQIPASKLEDFKKKHPDAKIQ